MKPLTIALVAFALSSCSTDSAVPLATAIVDTLPGGARRVSSPGPTAWHDTSGWRLVADGGIRGEAGTPGEIINPMMIDVDDAGRVYVVDQSPAAIKVYGTDGELVRVIGRDGEGPGEYRAAFIALRGAHLAVHDPRLSRTSLFDTAGTFIRSWASTCCYWTQPGFDRAGRIVVPLVSTDETISVRYIRFDTLGRTLDTLVVPQRESPKGWTVAEKGVRMMMVSVPFTPTTVHELHPDGGLVLGWSGAYELVRSNLGGDTAMVFSRAWTPKPIDDARRRSTVETMIEQQRGDIAREVLERAYRLDDVPTTLPAFSGIVVDREGNTWVVTETDSTRSELDVFDPDGAWLGTVQVPAQVRSYGPTAWGRDVLYLVQESEEGNPYVARYRLARGQGSER